MDTKQYKQITIVGKKNIISYLKTHNDGNPHMTEELVRAEQLECDVPGEVFSAVAGTHRTDVACRINTITKDDGKLVSSVTHIYNVLVRRSDGAVWRINTTRAPLYLLEPIPIETAHGPMFTDMEAILSGLAVREPKRFRKAGEDTVEKWTKFCDKIRKEETRKFLEQEESARAFYDRACRAFGDKIKVLQQTGPNVTKFSLDYGQLRFTYEEQDGKWYRTVNINPLAVPSDEDLFGKAPDWVDLGLPSGRLWTTENEPGYHQFDEAVKTFGDMLPSAEAWEELFVQCDREWDDKRKGLTFTGPNGNTLFLPADGLKDWNGKTKELSDDGVINVGSRGYYWSSSPFGVDCARGVYFNGGGVLPQCSNYRLYGFSIRLSKTTND